MIGIDRLPVDRLIVAEIAQVAALGLIVNGIPEVVVVIVDFALRVLLLGLLVELLLEFLRVRLLEVALLFVALFLRAIGLGVLALFFLGGVVSVASGILAVVARGALLHRERAGTVRGFGRLRGGVGRGRFESGILSFSLGGGAFRFLFLRLTGAALFVAAALRFVEFAVEFGLGADHDVEGILGFDREAEEFGEARELFGKGRMNEGHGFAAGGGAARAADAVDVGFHVAREVVVDDAGKRSDVEAARGDVGRDEDAQFPVSEVFERLFALGLRALGVEHRGFEAVLEEVLEHAVSAGAGAREDEDAVKLVVDDEVAQIDGHARGRKNDEALLHVGDVAVSFVDSDGVLENRLGDVFDLVVPGGREEPGRNLRFLPEVPHDVVDFLAETQVKQLIPFAEHEALKFAHVGRFLLDEVERAARRRNPEVDPVLERRDLRSETAAAHGAEHGDVQTEAELRGGARRLLGELAHGAQNEGPDLLCLRGLLLAQEPLEKRKEKGGGLAASGVGNGHAVRARQEGRNGGLLHGSGLLPRQGLDILQNRVGKTQIAKRFRHGCICGRVERAAVLTG